MSCIPKICMDCHYGDGYERSMNERESLQQQLASLREEVKKWQGELGIAYADRDIARAEVERLKAEVERLENKLDDEIASFISVQEAWKRSLRENTVLTQALSSLREKVRGWANDVDTIADHEPDWKYEHIIPELNQVIREMLEALEQKEEAAQ